MEEGKGEGGESEEGRRGERREGRGEEGRRGECVLGALEWSK